MIWVERTIEEFGRSIGIPGLRFNSKGLVHLTLEAMGSLFVEKADGAVLVYLAREAPFLSVPALTKALARCHYEENHAYPVHAALRGENQLVFLVRMEQNDFTLPALETVITLLGRLHDSR